MQELVEGKNTIGRPAAVLKKPYEATFNLFFLITMLNVARLFQWSIIIIFNISKYTEALVPPQQQFKIQSW